MKVARLGPDVAGYLAGLIDGEGTITLTRVHRNESRRLVVSISNNDLELLQYVMAAVGVGHITGKRIYSPRHAPSFTYQVSSRQALELLRQTAPFLRSYKARRARLALAEYVARTPRNGKYRIGQRVRRAEFEAKLLAIRPWRPGSIAAASTTTRRAAM
jgi:LAGLIDADG-like domain